jgi:hypothetical protein
MNKFNKVIKIEVSVDDIANQLLAQISPDFKHRELLTEAIIGSSLEKNNLSYVYGALSGFTGDVDFQVGDSVVCKSQVYNYIQRPQTEPPTEVKYDQQYVQIGDCKVVEINKWSENKLMVEYTETLRDGKQRTDQKWVDHKECNKV